MRGCEKKNPISISDCYLFPIRLSVNNVRMFRMRLQHFIGDTLQKFPFSILAIVSVLKSFIVFQYTQPLIDVLKESDSGLVPFPDTISQSFPRPFFFKR